MTQIALSLVVVFAAGLLTRTLQGLETVDLGFKPDRVLALNVDPAANGYSSADASRILDEILRRTRSLPGVRAASLAASTPGGSMAISMSVEVPGYTPTRPGDDIADFNFISPSYFQTVGQPQLRGRDFTQGDDKTSTRVAIVNEKFARHFFDDQNPVGRKFRQGGSEVEIAGVVGDARDRDTRKGPEAAVYLPEKQGQTSGLTLLVRTVSTRINSSRRCLQSSETWTSACP
ncbi:MAG: ABC transporter permease [Acidobacteriota bacterium]|nr:ABC transporter permease [Acidobacteriota bacterium]